MRKYRHKITGREFETELIGCNKIEGIVWGDWKIPMWVLEDSCDWEEVKNYEILSYTYDGQLVTKRENGKYLLSNTEIEDEFQGATLEEVKSFWDSKKHKIYSVKRLSDGEVFTVGDIIKGKKLIEIFAAPSNNRDLVLSLEGMRRALYIIEDCPIKVDKILFTTEDGIELFGGESVFSVTDDFILCYTSCIIEDNGKGVRLFAKKENAEKFISNNKKMYTLKDMVKIANHWAYIKSVTPEVAQKVIESWTN